MISDDIGKRILCLSFNQTNTCLAVGSTKGFRIIRLEDSKTIIKRDEDSQSNFPGGFSLVIPVFSTPLICLVGSSSNARYPFNTVYFWDDYKTSSEAEIHFRFEVKNALVRRDRIVIILEKITYVYVLNNLQALASIETISNEKGVGAISYDKDIFVLVSLSKEPGHLRMENFYTNEVKSGQVHENPITYVAIDFIGSIGASASAQGTIIRVFDCAKLEVLYELRRGSRPAEISSIAFSPNQNYLVVTSNKSTVHAWKLEKKEKSYTSMISRYLPNYFQYSRSLGKLSLKTEIDLTCPYSNITGPKACFFTENEFFIACLDGNIHKCSIHPVSGEISIAQSLQYFGLSSVSVVERGRTWNNIE
ncbi:hypothetical protein SteCoe_8928 [Stentor coeruleus]|uniref:Uncharacterized protein n=1 Tax=Stentor coeruleus TaxID=5963 RepID=A0A1R2CJ38_9CILI|nr:hypothetical protein SteCoe_8928 [Stentor coeruleus]